MRPAFRRRLPRPVRELLASARDTIVLLREFRGALIILIKGLTPFPFKVLTILSGMVKLNLLTFTLASLVARAGRFFLVAGLLYVYGEKVRGFLEKHLETALLLFALLVVGGFVAIKFLI
ncbi:MAG: hypothetical protein HY023_13250 [Chloroflexi bacterium]|nr:hypothetical protein [Chloroflexota bacterium]